MRLPYYVALLSAAALHGASHQQPQVFQVMTDRSVRPISAGRTRVVLSASRYVARAVTVEVKTATGSMRVSTPETTAVDLVRFAKAAGHLDHVASVLDELAPAIDARRLVRALGVVNDVPNAQRLGYLLDLVRHRALAEAVHGWSERRAQRILPLRPDLPADHARISRRWHLLLNAAVEVAA